MKLPLKVSHDSRHERHKHWREKRTRHRLPNRVTTRELLFILLEEVWEMEQELQRLADDISGLTSVVEGSITLLDKLAAMVAAIPTTDPATQAKITELANAVEATKAQLADAVARDTPAEEPAPAPTEPPAEPA